MRGAVKDRKRLGLSLARLTSWLLRYRDHMNSRTSSGQRRNQVR